MILDSQPWLTEPSLVEIPWKALKKIQTPLKIGVIWNDGIVQPHPPITRCLQETVNALQAAGHTCIIQDTTLHRELIDCINKLYFLDAGEEYRNVLKAGEESASPLMKWILEGAPKTPYSAAETWKVRISFDIFQGNTIQIGINSNFHYS